MPRLFTGGVLPSNIDPAAGLVSERVAQLQAPASEQPSRSGRAAWQRRPMLAAGLAIVMALGAAIAAALLTPRLSGPSLLVATWSADASEALQELGASLPFGYAFAVGMAAAVNPCGIALLPTYLGLYLGTSGQGAATQRGWPMLLGRALLVSATMTASFVALFGLAGLLLGTVAAAAGTLLPWISVLVGLLLVLAGGHLLAGSSLSAAAPGQLAARLGGVAGRAGVVGYAAYGVAFALSSLGCTLPLFLAVVGSALAVGLLAGLAEFVLYALGMGAVILVLTVMVAIAGRSALRHVRVLGRYLQPLGAALLLVTGAYIIYYWLTAGGILGP
jgi:cytochrome c biogenesis protein CcdA